MIIASNWQSKAHITHRHTNSIWFSPWIMGWKTRMRYILKQNKSILNLLFLVMISSFRRDIKNCNTRRSLKKQEVLHGPIVHGCMFLWLIKIKLRLKCGPTFSKEIHNWMGCPIWNPPSWCSSTYSDSLCGRFKGKCG